MSFSNDTCMKGTPPPPRHTTEQVRNNPFSLILAQIEELSEFESFAVFYTKIILVPEEFVMT